MRKERGEDKQRKYKSSERKRSNEKEANVPLGGKDGHVQAPGLHSRRAPSAGPCSSFQIAAPAPVPLWCLPGPSMAHGHQTIACL